MNFEQWNGFNKKGEWTKEIDVRDFIQIITNLIQVTKNF